MTIISYISTRESTIFCRLFSSSNAVTARRTRSSRPDERSSGQNRGFALGCFFRSRLNAHVRQVVAFRGAVGDCDNHFGYCQLVARMGIEP